MIPKQVFQSHAWLALAAHLRSEIERMRAENDAITLPPDKTAALRGEIKFAKNLLALAENSSAPQISDPDLSPM